ncbi:MAG: hypothetical protein Q7J57_09660 [Gemmobacter sp.]|nr:hypothetical protein [Gemmobacter sp.]
MTIDTPVTGNGFPGDVISEAWELYDTAAKIMRMVLHEMKHEPKDSARELALYTKDVREALKLVISERAAVDKLRRDTGAVEGNHGFDFDTARDEIGRRLACLRDAGGGG